MDWWEPNFSNTILRNSHDSAYRVGRSFSVCDVEHASPQSERTLAQWRNAQGIVCEQNGFFGCFICLSYLGCIT